jgi:hypothetical protein
MSAFHLFPIVHAHMICFGHAPFAKFVRRPAAIFESHRGGVEQGRAEHE